MGTRAALATSLMSVSIDTETNQYYIVIVSPRCAVSWLRDIPHSSHVDLYACTRADDVRALRRGARALWLARLAGAWQPASLLSPLPLTLLHPNTAIPSTTHHCNHEGNHILGHRYGGWHCLRWRPQDAAQEGPVV